MAEVGTGSAKREKNSFSAKVQCFIQIFNFKYKFRHGLIKIFFSNLTLMTEPVVNLMFQTHNSQLAYQFGFIWVNK